MMPHVYYAADGISGGAASNAIADGIAKASQAASAPSISDGMSEAHDGLSKKEASLQEMLASLPESMKKIVDQLTNLVSPQGDKNNPLNKLASDLTSTLGKVFPSMGKGKGNGEEGGDGLSKALVPFLGPSIAASKLKPSPNDLMALGGRDSLGPLLIYWKLDEIHKAIKGDEKKKGGSGGGIKDLFKDLFNGAGGIAALAGALMLFAGAMVIFQAVDWGSAVVGLALFTGFIFGSVQLAKYLKKTGAEQDFKDFAKSTLWLTAAFAGFAVAVLVAGLVVKSGYFQWGLIALGCFSAFIVGAVFLAKFTNKEKGNFLQFAQSSLILTASIGVFSLAILAAGYVAKSPYFLPGLGVAALFGGFALGMAALAKMVNANQADYRQFAISSLLIMASLVTFSLAILFLGSMSIATILKGTAMIGVFAGTIVLMKALAVMAKDCIKDMASVALIGLLMAATFILFGLGIRALGSIEPIMIAKAALALVASIVLVGILAALGVLITPIAPVIFTGLGLMALAGALMAITMTLFAAGIKVLGGLNKKMIDQATSNLGTLSTFLGSLGIMALVSIPAAAMFLVGGALLTLAAPMMILVATALAGTVSLMSKLNPTELQQASSNSALLSGTMVAIATATLSAVTAGLLAIPALVFLPLILTAVGGISAIVSTFARLEIPPNAKDKADSVSAVLSSIGGIRGINPLSALALLASINPLSLAMQDIAVVIRTMASLDSATIESGKANLGQIGDLFADETSKFSFLAVLKRLGGVSKEVVNSAVALNQITSSFRNVAETILMINNVGDVSGSIASLDGIASFAGKLNEMFGASSGGIGSLITGLFGKGPTEKVAALKDIVDRVRIDLIPGIVAISKEVGDVSGLANLANALESLNKISSTKVDPKAIDNINRALTGFDTKGLDSVANALQRISASIDMQDRVQPLLSLADKAADFEKVAAALNNIAVASSRVKGNNVFDALNLQGGSVLPAPSRKVSADNISGDSGNRLEDIYNLLSQWFTYATANGNLPGGFQTEAGLNGTAVNAQNLAKAQNAAQSKGFFASIFGG